MIDFFSPLSNSFVSTLHGLPEGSLGKQISFYKAKDSFPSLKKVKFAIFGSKENRNQVDYKAENLCFDGVRESFYSLFPGNWNHKIVDLGDIEKGNTVEDTYFAVKTVIAELLRLKIIPIILGGGQDLVYGQYRAYDGFEKMVNIVNIDSKFDLGNAELPINNKSYIGKIIIEKPYNLFNYSVLGYQSYFNAPEEIALLDKLYFDAYRLGEISNDITSVEPIMRNADIVSLDINAINGSELCFKDTASPNGINSREICAIARYAGISNKTSSFGVYEIPSIEKASNASMLIAQILWYFIEGVNYRVFDEDFDNNNNFATYKVPIDEEVLVFKKSLKTERWWIELPFISNVNNKLKSKTLLPCTYGEYLSACDQEIPERWFKARQKNEV